MQIIWLNGMSGLYKSGVTIPPTPLARVVRGNTVKGAGEWQPAPVKALVAPSGWWPRWKLISVTQFLLKTCTAQCGFYPFWPEKMGSVDFDRKNWFWSISAEKSGFGRFWPNKLVPIDFGQKTSFWLINSICAQNIHSAVFTFFYSVEFFL